MKYLKQKILRIKPAMILMGALLASISFAQDVSFTAKGPSVVRAGEKFQVIYNINQRISDFTHPDFGEFSYLGGPSQESGSSVSTINGRIERTFTYTFTYYIQAPAEAGKYTIQPASATFKRKKYDSNALEIEVLAGTASSGSSSSGKQGGGAAADAPAGENIFIRLELDKTTAYVGEQITAWVKLYADPDVNLAGFDQRFKGPEFVGFFIQNVELLPLTSLERQKLGDEIYHTGVLRKVILYPQKAGEIYIEPFDLLVEIQDGLRRTQSIFDDFFGMQYQRKRLNLKSKRIKINVKPLPGNQPHGFSGAVGNFKIDASANADEIITNDAVTFKVEISGQGNIKLIDELVTNFPPTFDVFDPVRKVNLNENTDGKTGKVSFEYTAIPRHTGTFNIPPFSLVYFDTSTGSYKTLSTRSFAIRVNKGENDSTTVVSGNLSKEAIELLGSDIRYIEPSTRLKPRDSFIFGKIWYFEIFITLLLIFVGILIVRREQMKRSVDVIRYRNRKAGKIVNKRLRKASRLLKANDAKAFYDELERALWGYLSDKLSIPVSDLSIDRVRAELSERGIDDERNKEFQLIIEQCQFARYAPGDMQLGLTDLFRQAKSIINKLDQKL